MKLNLAHLTLASLLIGPGITFAAYHKIQAGDTLTQIAESNYGNWVKWKDLWKLNQDHISNPDLIYPGQRLRLLTDEELALFVKNDSSGTNPHTGMPGDESASDAESGTIKSRPRHGSQEWRLLPLQNWEKFVFQSDPSIDPDGFDRRSRVSARVAEKSTAILTIASDRIPILGEVSNARSEYSRLFLGDQIFLRADEQLQVGTTYSITTGPQKIVSKRDGRVGFGYDLTGKVRVIGVRDGLFIGTIVAIYYPIQRHQLLIPEVKDFIFPDPVAAPSAMNASILVPHGAQEDLLGQEKIVLLDVGTEDGVKPGMIFRHYLHHDPYTEEPISAKDFLIEAELKVLSVQDKFSVAIILNSHALLHFGDDLVSLSDLKDFEKNQGLQTVIQDSTKTNTVDDLDSLDANDGLGEKENHDLRQLEKWSKPAPMANAPSSSGVSDDEIQRVDTHEHPRETYEIGKEPAPNDGTSKPQTAPTPAATPVPIPEVEPSVAAPTPADTTASPEATPADVAPAPDTSASPAEPAPGDTIPAAPVPSADPAPDAAPSAPNADPFATPSP